MRRLGTLVALLLLVASAGALILGAEKAPKPDPNLQLPEYRSWPHVKSMVIFDEKHPLFASFGGLHHVYANDKAFPSTGTLKAFPDGSVLVFVLFELAEKDGAYATGAKKLTAVMEKAGKYKDTGGWGFQAWGADGKLRVLEVRAVVDLLDPGSRRRCARNSSRSRSRTGRTFPPSRR
jgi:hypothetical protein